MNGRFPKVAPKPAETDFAGLANVGGDALAKLGIGLDEAFAGRDAQLRELYAYVGVLVRRCNDAERDILRLRIDLKKKTRKAPARRRPPRIERTHKERP